MAERRMFAKTLIDSDTFLELPQSTQLLYFHLCLRADDEGFVNKAKSILRSCGCTAEDLTRLVREKFLIRFDSGVVVIRHWKVHNYIRNDRIRSTVHEEERAALSVEPNGAYTLCQSGDGQAAAQDRLGKDRLGKDRSGKDRSDQDRSDQDRSDQDRSDQVRPAEQSAGQQSAGGCSMPEPCADFQPPSVTEVMIYCKQRKNKVDPERFVQFYASRGWRGVRDWQEVVRSWEGGSG